MAKRRGPVWRRLNLTGTLGVYGRANALKVAESMAFGTYVDTAVLDTTEAVDTVDFALSGQRGIDLAATEAVDTAAFVIAARHNITLTATEAKDTASVSVSAFYGLVLARTELPDTAAIALQLSGSSTASLAATEAKDTAAFSAVRQSALLAGGGSYSYLGDQVFLTYDRLFNLLTSSYTLTGNQVTLARGWTLFLGQDNYIVTGVAARLYDSAFFYTDSEVIYVPQEVAAFLIAPAAVDADEPIVVPDEIQLLSLGFEDRQIAVPANELIEELTEYRAAVGEARMRMA